MPRRTHVYWITKPHDLKKCHSRRCPDDAVADRLCMRHQAAWLLDGKRPPMPDYSEQGAANTSPLETLLENRRQELTMLLEDIAGLPTDEISSIEQFQQALEFVDSTHEELKAERSSQIDMLKEAIAKADRKFEPLRKLLASTRELATVRLESTRTTMRALAPAGRSQRRDESLDRQMTSALSHGKK